LKLCLYLETTEMYISGERKALGTFTLRLSHVSVDVKVTSGSQFALVSICVRRYRACNRIIEYVMFWEIY